MKKISGSVLAFFLCCLLFAVAYGQEEVTMKGLITGRTGDSLTLQTTDGDKTISLTDDTKVQTPKGLGVFRKQQMSWTSLIPGLKVSVKALQSDDGRLEATTINFSKGDLETASMIQAGLAPTEQKVAANKEAISTNQSNIATNASKIEANEEEVNQRFESLTDYDVKDQLVVYFPSGVSALTDKDKAKLSQLGTAAAKLPGYIIEVKGFADSTGNAAANQTLSRDRAYAVVNYLMQDCNISPRHIVSPGAMGISNPVASNETSQGRTQNRRVEAKVMVNKGVAAGK